MPPVDAASLFGGRANGGIATYGGGGECFLYAGHFDFERRAAGMLLGLLPPIVHIREEDDRAALRWSLDRMMAELGEPRPGGDLVVEHLAHLVLVQALRLQMADGGAGRVGWLFALADDRLGGALSALHAAPARRWSVAAMATLAGMSRTAFAVRFKSSVGQSPMEYLTRWRMMLAADAMQRQGRTVASAALSVGYASEAAFSTAFKRLMGCSPRRYGRSPACS